MKNPDGPHAVPYLSCLSPRTLKAFRTEKWTPGTRDVVFAVDAQGDGAGFVDAVVADAVVAVPGSVLGIVL